MSARGAMINVADARRRARRVLPRALFDYIDGGADDEITLHENEAAFRDYGFVPRMGSGVQKPSISTHVFGERLSMPVVLAPCGLVSMMHPDGPAGIARAAAKANLVSVLSTVAGASPEQVAEDSRGPKWFQLYSPGGRDDARALIERVAASGYTALVITIDTPALGNRERDARNGMAGTVGIELRALPKLVPQLISRPGWVAATVKATVKARRTPAPSGPTVGLVASGGSPFSWDDVAYYRTHWQGPLLVKGVLSGADARRSVEAGAEGVIVSNHGGRQLDGAPATLRVLPEVVEHVGKDATVLLDGGVRRGSDIMKAVALGAAAVLIGRPYLYGLAVNGQAGVEEVLSLLRRDMLRTMALLGCPSIEELGPEWLSKYDEGDRHLDD